MFSKAINSLKNRRGDLVTNVIAGIIIFVAVAGAMVMFYNSNKAQQNAVEMEAAGDAAAKKLEELLNTPWAAAALTPGEHDDGSAKSTFRWIVTDVPGKPRLKKIQVVKKHEHKVSRDVASKGTLVEGYRYNDF